MRRLNALELTVLARKYDEIGESDPMKVVENFGGLIKRVIEIKDEAIRAAENNE